MTLDLAVPETTASGVVLDHEGILRSLNLNARDPKVQAMLLICERYQIDPLMKHAVLISGNIYITRDGYLHVAHRSGQFDGIEVLETGETPTHFTAKVAVYRKDMRHPFTYTGRFPKAERMAKTFGPEMAVKVAEVQALRRAFNVTGVAASDERWDVDPSEVTHATPARDLADEAIGEGLAGYGPPPALPPADAETGEVIEAPATTRRRPPPAQNVGTCPEQCGFTGDRPAMDGHVIADHGYYLNDGRIVRPKPPGAGVHRPAPENGTHDVPPGAGAPAPPRAPEEVAAEGAHPPAAAPPGDLRSDKQNGMLLALCAKTGKGERQDRLDWASDTLGRFVPSFSTLTKREASTLIDVLNGKAEAVAERG